MNSDLLAKQRNIGEIIEYTCYLYLIPIRYIQKRSEHTSTFLFYGLKFKRPASVYTRNRSFN